MDNNNTRPQSDAEWYCRKNLEEERFYEIFFQMCHKHGVHWVSATQEERRFIEEVTNVAYTSEYTDRTS